LNETSACASNDGSRYKSLESFGLKDKKFLLPESNEVDHVNKASEIVCALNLK
jgi:hypothetical protein